VKFRKEHLTIAVNAHASVKK